MLQTFAPNGNGAAPAYAPPSMLPPGQQQPQSGETGFERGNGEHVLPASPPPQSAGGLPAWPAYQQQQPTQQAPQQPVYPQYQAQPQYQPVQQFQQPQMFAAPQAPPPPVYQPQQQMQQDPALQQRQGFQFNDQLRLAGMAGGGMVQQPPPVQPQAAPYQGSPALVGAQPTFAYPQQQAQQQNLLIQQLAQRGLPVGQYANDQQFLEEIGQGYQELQAFRAQQRFNGAPAGSSGEDLTGQQSGVTVAQAAQVATAGAPPTKRAAPEWRPEWSSLVTQDDATGMFKAVDPTVVPPAIVQRANEYASWKRERGEQLLRDPMAIMREEGLEQFLTERDAKLKQSIVDEFRQQEVQQKSQAAVTDFLNKNKAHLFVLDQQGQPAQNWRGEYLRTPLGEHLNQQAVQIRQQFQEWYGREPDPRHVMAELEQRLAPYVPQQQPQPGFQPPAQQAPAYQQYVPQQQVQQFQTPQPAYYQQPPQFPPLPNRNEQLKDNLYQRQLAMRGEAYAPNQQGTVASAQASPVIPQNTRLSFEQMLKNSAIEKGILHPSTY